MIRGGIMRKNKVLKGGFVSAAVALAMAVALVGCTPMSEVVPEKYGEWEGYYVYRGNVRSKTTGEEDVYLVETLEKDGVIYSVTATNDYLYQEDDIWLCLEIAPQNEIAGKTPYTSCLVRYDMENWQATPIYYGYEFDADNVHLVKEDVIVLSREGKQEVFYTVDYYGNIVEENAWRYGEYEYFADRAYAVKTEKGKISFAPVSTENCTTMFVSNAHEQ